MLDFLPHDNEVVKGEGEINTIAFSDLELVPKFLMASRMAQNSLAR